MEPRHGDVYLLCSDGLTNMLSDAAILEIVRDTKRDVPAYWAGPGGQAG